MVDIARLDPERLNRALGLRNGLIPTKPLQTPGQNIQQAIGGFFPNIRNPEGQMTPESVTGAFSTPEYRQAAINTGAGILGIGPRLAGQRAVAALPSTENVLGTGRQGIANLTGETFPERTLTPNLGQVTPSAAALTPSQAATFEKQVQVARGQAGLATGRAGPVTGTQAREFAAGQPPVVPSLGKVNLGAENLTGVPAEALGPARITPGGPTAQAPRSGQELMPWRPVDTGTVGPTNSVDARPVEPGKELAYSSATPNRPSGPEVAGRSGVEYQGVAPNRQLAVIPPKPAPLPPQRWWDWAPGEGARNAAIGAAAIGGGIALANRFGGEGGAPTTPGTASTGGPWWQQPVDPMAEAVNRAQQETLGTFNGKPITREQAGNLAARLPTAPAGTMPTALYNASGLGANLPSDRSEAIMNAARSGAIRPDEALRLYEGQPAREAAAGGLPTLLGQPQESAYAREVREANAMRDLWGDHSGFSSGTGYKRETPHEKLARLQEHAANPLYQAPTTAKEDLADQRYAQQQALAMLNEQGRSALEDKRFAHQQAIEDQRALAQGARASGQVQEKAEAKQTEEEQKADADIVGVFKTNPAQAQVLLSQLKAQVGGPAARAIMQQIPSTATAEEMKAFVSKAIGGT